MIDLTIGKEKYELPENYDELSLGRFIELSKVLDNQKEYKSDLRFSLEILSKLIGCDSSLLYDLSIDDVALLSEEIKWINENPKKVNNKKVKIDGKEYIAVNTSNITTGEMISIESFQQNITDNRDNLHYVMSILFRPILNGKPAPLEDDFEVIKERAELFKEKMMIGEVYGPLMGFTSGVNGSSSKSSGRSSILKSKKRKVSSGKK